MILRGRGVEGARSGLGSREVCVRVCIYSTVFRCPFGCVCKRGGLEKKGGGGRVGDGSA